jgi:hypothetical protein
MTEENSKLDWFRNHYHCEECNLDWDMEWDATCDDRCPKCDHAYTPVSSESIEEPHRKIPNQSNEDIKKLALCYVENGIFTSADIRPNSVELGMVFMPLLFGAVRGLDVNDIGLVYSEMGSAGPRSVNGYPMFTSCRFLNQHDNKLFWEYVDILNAQREAFLNSKVV